MERKEHFKSRKDWGSDLDNYLFYVSLLRCTMKVWGHESSKIKFTKNEKISKWAVSRPDSLSCIIVKVSWWTKN